MSKLTEPLVSKMGGRVLACSVKSQSSQSGRVPVVNVVNVVSSVSSIGVTAVAGLLSSEALRDERSDQDVLADEAFEFFDADGNGVIQRGDIE